MGQQSNTFYLMHQVPQSNLLNPAIQAACKWYVGIPVLASSHISYSNTAFTYNDLAGTDTWNLEGVYSQMHRVDLVSAEAILYPVSIGYRHRSYYFTLHIAEKAHAYQTVPRELAEMVVFGNGPYVGKTENFRAFRPAGYYQREYSLGVSKVLNRRWTAGARARLLFGKARLVSNRSDMRFTTGEHSFDLLLEGSFNVNSSLPATISQDPDGNITGISLDEVNIKELLLNRGNPGFAVDLGMVYRMDERTTLSASLLDLGLVRWRTDLNNVKGTGSFPYQGVDAGTDVISFDFAEEILDSILNSFDFTVTQRPFSSTLPLQLYLGGSYRLNERFSLGAVNRNVIFRSKVHSSVTLLAQADLGGRLLGTASWSYLNNSLLNIGAGIAYHGSGFQIHAVSDNLLGFFFPFDTRTVNLRVGFNLLFGCPRNKQENLEAAAYGSLPTGGNCSWTRKPKIRERQMQRAARRQNRN